ncbi:hypothetical protein BDY17DRAFT_108822 [Neohortaea acidophila]|uniref:Uncharacterized protein n=1 Tax=Neohortaea acidophila TaxID=245834 RepID=A0A6A6Q0W2_9PEZI|nr:uncharacterized protein BDY17DRAFT_108822 [Neohortaea acidophila]KAF2485626.1 hypothetical protein BDY17DRAFT_108822 [Neohortaea acidophila]
MSCRLARPGYTWLQNLGFYAMKNDWERTVHVKDQESTSKRRPPCCKLKATNARNIKTGRRVVVFSWASPRTGRVCGDCNICRKFAGMADQDNDAAFGIRKSKVVRLPVTSRLVRTFVSELPERLLLGRNTRSRASKAAVHDEQVFEEQVRKFSVAD